MDCCRIGAIAFLLAQTAWLVSSFNETPVDKCQHITAYRVTALAMTGFSVVAAVAATRNDSIALPAAAMAIVCTGTTAMYASKLRPDSVITKMGYGSALFSVVASLILLATTLHEDEPTTVIVVASAPIESGTWNYLYDDDDALF